MMIAQQECPLWVNSGHMDLREKCPLYPQERTFSEGAFMSAKCHKRTLCKVHMSLMHRQSSRTVDEALRAKTIVRLRAPC
jgi:hypothetical protein